MVITFQSSADNVEAVDNSSFGCSSSLIKHFQANIHKHKIMTSLSFSGTWLIVKNKTKTMTKIQQFEDLWNTEWNVCQIISSN